MREHGQRTVRGVRTLAWAVILGSLVFSGCEAEAPPQVEGGCPPACPAGTEINDPAELVAIAGELEFFVEILDVLVVPERNEVLLATNANGIQVVDVSRPDRPSFRVSVGQFSTPLSETSELAGNPVLDVANNGHVQHLARFDWVPEGMSESSQLVVGAHHGDEFLPNAHLVVLEIPGGTQEGPSMMLPTWSMYYAPHVRFERIAVSGDLIFAAAKDQGLMVFRAVPGTLEVVSTLGGIENAWGVAVRDEHAHVGDAAGSLHVVDVSVPESPQRVGSLPLAGVPRDVSFLDDSHLLVASGAAGVHVVDISVAASPVLISTIQSHGTAMNASASGNRVDVATWEAIEMHDLSEPTSPVLLATETGETLKDFARFLAVDSMGPLTFGGEWHALHLFEVQEGAVAPEIWLSTHEVDLGPGTDGIGVQGVVVRNTGHLALEMECDAESAPACEPTSMTLAPGAQGYFEVSHALGEEKLETSLRILSNDPDELERVLNVYGGGGGLGPGDMFPPASFTAPDTGQVLLSPTMFQGTVTLLSYFATF